MSLRFVPRPTRTEFIKFELSAGVFGSLSHPTKCLRNCASTLSRLVLILWLVCMPTLVNSAKKLSHTENCSNGGWNWRAARNSTQTQVMVSCWCPTVYSFTSRYTQALIRQWKFSFDRAHKTGCSVQGNSRIYADTADIYFLEHSSLLCHKLLILDVPSDNAKGEPLLKKQGRAREKQFTYWFAIQYFP